MNPEPPERPEPADAGDLPARERGRAEAESVRYSRRRMERARPATTTGRTGGAWVRVKVSRRKRHRRRVIRRIILAAFGGLLLLAAAYLVVTGLIARSQLTEVRGEVARLRAQISAGDLDAARATAKTVAEHAHRAHQLTTGPIWAAAAWLPGGGPLESVRRIAASVDLVGGDALPRLVAATDVVDPSNLRAADGTVDLAPISAASPDLTRAATTMARATDEVAGAPADTWLPAADSARSDLLDQLTSLSRTVEGAAIAARIAPAMLGASGPKDYMVSFETEAELRGTGGLPGAFAILHADHGKVRFVRFESDSTLRGVRSGLDLGIDFDRLYAGDKAPDEYADSNVSPHFPYAARIWVAMWHNYSGQTLDGAFALDPTALSFLLGVTGPARLPDGSSVSAANVVALTQKDIYTRYTDSTVRKQRQLDIARAIGRHVVAGNPDTTALLRAAGKAAGERRLLGWSADPAIEADLARTPFGGAVPVSDAPFVGLAVNNAAATKLDYYLNASLTWQRSGCGSQRMVTVTITITNDVPDGLPTYVYGQTGQPNRPQHKGDNRIRVSYLGTTGAEMTSVTLDGKRTGAAVGRERGHIVLGVLLPIAQHGSHTIVFHLDEPERSGAPVIMSQPMVEPLQLSVEDADCG